MFNIVKNNSLSWTCWFLRIVGTPLWIYPVNIQKAIEIHGFPHETIYKWWIVHIETRTGRYPSMVSWIVRMGKKERGEVEAAKAAKWRPKLEVESLDMWWNGFVIRIGTAKNLSSQTQARLSEGMESKRKVGLWFWKNEAPCGNEPLFRLDVSCQCCMLKDVGSCVLQSEVSFPRRLLVGGFVASCGASSILLRFLILKLGKVPKSTLR